MSSQYFLVGHEEPQSSNTDAQATKCTLGKIIPRRFLKPAVCKYPAIVNKSQIYTLLPKPYSLMWHIVRGNRVRNGRDRTPETRRMRSPKVALFENSYGQCAVQCRALWNQWWHGWWAQRLCVAEIACRVGVLCADSVNMCMSAW